VLAGWCGLAVQKSASRHDSIETKMVFINTCKLVVLVGKQNGLTTMARGISRYNNKPTVFILDESRLTLLFIKIFSARQ